MTHDVDRELSELLHSLREGLLSERQFFRLSELLRADRRARRTYVRYMMLCAKLKRTLSSYPVDMSESQREGCAPCNDVTVGADMAEPSVGPALENQGLPLSAAPSTLRLETIRLEAQRRLEAFLAREHAGRKALAPQPRPRISLQARLKGLARRVETTLTLAWRLGVIAAVCLGLGLTAYVTILYVISRQPVARLGEQRYAEWVNGPREPSLRRGLLTLEEGFATIHMLKGADLLVQAPCVLELASSNRVFLQSGWLTATVPPRARGFTVVTPTSRVVDFGTEFGVGVGNLAHSEIHVFSGDVQLTTRPSGPIEKRSLSLGEGEAASADASGALSKGTLNERSALFVRRLPGEKTLGLPGRRLDLTDVVAGGNGFGSGGDYGRIQPGTGLFATPNNWHGNIEDTLGGSAHAYRPVPMLSYVDGVFIPDGEGPCVISSQGHHFAACPDTDGRHWWQIWAVQAPNRSLAPSLPADAPGILLHANLGLTFDLEAMREAQPGMAITHFSARAGIPLAEAPEYAEADVWVLVDGTVRFQRRGVRPTQMYEVSLPLSRKDHYLTLIATDGGRALKEGSSDFFWFDQCVFVEPILSLESERRIRAEATIDP